MNTTIESEVIKIAAEELGVEPEELTAETRLDTIFADSLEYVAFTVRLGDLGTLPEIAVSEAETLGDLAHAIILPN